MLRGVRQFSNTADRTSCVPLHVESRQVRRAHLSILCDQLTLAARPDLERWLDRLTKRSDQLREIGLAAGIPADQSRLHKVDTWGYGNV